VFFGRADEVGQLAGLLQSPAERAEGAALLVVGGSVRVRQVVAGEGRAAAG
jgi:hypothetical protein